MPNFVHGKNTAVSLGGHDLSAYCNSCDFAQKVDKAETTTFVATGADPNKTYLAGFKDNTAKLAGLWDATLEGWMAALNGADGTVLIYGPAGNASGKPRITGTGIVENYAISDKHNAPLGWTADFQISGAVTRDTYP